MDITVDSVVPTKYWHRLPDGRIQCDVCPRYCKLHEGQRGLCFVRARQNDQIVLTTYGRSSGFAIDPIEKKPLNHFLPGTPVLSFGTAGCNLACKFCFHPDTLIATKEGLHPIKALFEACEEKIAYEDGHVGFPAHLEVWTRQGGTARVTKVFAHPYAGDLLSLKAMAAPPILLTPDHRVFAAHRSDPQAIRKIPAGELTDEHYLVIPKRQAGQGTFLPVKAILEGLETGFHAPRQRRVPPETLEAALAEGTTSKALGTALGYHPAYVRKLRGQWARGEALAEAPRPIRVQIKDGRARFLGERGPGIPERLALTPDLAWLLGLYCAEGHVSAHPSRPHAHQLVFSLGPDEQALAEKAAQLLARIFDLRASVQRRRTTLTVVCSSTSAARLFAALCGKGAREKQVPWQLLQAEEAAIRGFLEGYMAGDGHRTETHLVGTTVSERLALGLYELGLHLDLLPTFFTHRPAPRKTIEGREVSQAPIYIVKFKRDRYERKPLRERTAWKDIGGAFLVPLRHIQRIPYQGLVYNLEVDDPDHAYLAPFLAVSNCQNWDISKSREIDTLADQAPPALIAKAAEALGCRSVAYTYNDPVIFMEYAIDTAKACRELGIKSVAVTAGYIAPEPRKEFFAHMDAANIDLKGFTERFYYKLTGGHLQPVLDTLEYVAKETDVWLEITTLLIPGENDSDEELEAMSQWVYEHLGPDVPWHFTAFHPDYKMMNTPPTPPSTLRRAREIAMRHGMRYVYTGNVHDEEGQSTYCHHCGERLIGRDWYEITAWNLTADGRCRFCGTPCAGVFEAEPGHWGSRRLPVRLADFASLLEE